MLATFTCLNGSLRGILIMSYYYVTHMYLPNKRFSLHFTFTSLHFTSSTYYDRPLPLCRNSLLLEWPFSSISQLNPRCSPE